MTATMRLAKPEGRSVLGLAICIGLHALADLLLIGRAWFFENEQLWIVIALPLSQCSLAALWAAGSRASPYVRFAAPPVGAVVCWYILAKILPWGFGEPASAAWAIAVGTQTFAIIIAIHLYRLVWKPGQQHAVDAKQPSRSIFSFDLLTLMLWTTVIAVAFGFVQYGRVEWGWTAGVAEWDYFEVTQIVGLFNALLAVLWYWVMAAGSWQWRIAKTVIATLLMVPLAFLLWCVVHWMVGAPSIDLREALILASTQSVFLASMLAIVIPCS